MAVSNDLLLKIQADTSQAVVKISEIEKRLSELGAAGKKSTAQFSTLAGAFGSLGGASVALNQSLELAQKAFRMFVVPAMDAVKAFQKSEDATRRLANTLRLLGDSDVQRTIKGFGKLAKAMEDTTGVQSDAVLSLLSVAKASGLTNVQVERLAKTAANFAAGAGISFESAFLALQKSLKGSTLGISTFAPELMNLSKAQLQAGDAVEYLGKKYQGFADINSNSFAMSMSRSASALEDFQKSIGGVLSEILNIGSGTNLIVQSLKAMTQFIDSNKEAFVSWGKRLIGIFDDIFHAIDVMVELNKARIDGMAAAFFAVLEKIQRYGAAFGIIDPAKAEASKASFDKWASSATNALSEAGKAAAKIGVLGDTTLEQRGPSTKGPLGASGPMKLPPLPMNPEIKKAYDDAIQKNQELTAQIAAGMGLSRTAIDLETQAQILKLDQLESELKLKGLLNAQTSGEIDRQKELLKISGKQKRDSAPSDEFGGMMKAGQDIAGKISGAFLEGTAGAVMGAMNAAKLIVDALQGLIDFVPNLLNSVAKIFDSLADLPIRILEALMNIDVALDKFIDKFPEAMIKLFANLPKIIGNILYKLGEFIPLLNEAILRAIPPFITAVVKQAPRIAVAMAKGFISATVSMLKGLFDGSMFKMPKMIDAAAASSEIKKIAKTLTQEASRVFAVLDFTEGGKRADSIISQVEEAGKRAKEDAFAWWTNMTKAVGRFFSDGMQFLEGFGPAVDIAWQGFTNAIGPFFMAVANVFKSFLGQFLDGKKWAAAGQAIVAAFSNIGKIFFDIGKDIWNGLLYYFNSAGSVFYNIGATIWRGFEDLLSGAGNILKKVFKLDGDWGGGRGDVEKLLGIDVPFVQFAQGGIVPGQSMVPGDSLMNDRILALLSPGEAVIPRSKMSQPGVKSVVDMVLSGQLDPTKLGFGGWIGERVEAVTDTVTGKTNPFGDAFSSAWDSLSDAGKGVASTISDVAKVGFDAIKQAADSLGVPVENLLDEVLKRLGPGLRSMVSMNAQNAIGFSSGGMVPGHGTGDSVPAMLTPGEFVINRRSAQAMGLPALQALNSGGKLGGGGGNQVTVNQSIELRIDAKDGVDENFIRNKLMPLVKKELKRASLDGQFILAGSGVRA